MTSRKWSGNELSAGRTSARLSSMTERIAFSGDVETGRSALREDTIATVGFREMHVLTDKPSTGLMLMLGPKGNSRVRILSAVIGRLREREEVHSKVQADCETRDIDCPSPFPGTAAEDVMNSIPEESNT